MFLNKAKVGKNYKLLAIPSSIKADLIRLGFCEGDLVECIARIPAGPVVLQKALQETAIGNKHAQQIEVEEASA